MVKGSTSSDPVSDTKESSRKGSKTERETTTTSQDRIIRVDGRLIPKKARGSMKTP